jgi:SCP-2 sterol transfer family
MSIWTEWFDMIESIKTFVEAFQAQSHLLPLIQGVDLKVQLNGWERSFLLHIKNGTITLVHSSDQVDCEIGGDQIALNQLLEGKERMRILERNGQLKVSAPLRTMLLLESIFVLTKTENHLFARSS